MPYKVFPSEWDEASSLPKASSDGRLQAMAHSICCDIERLEQIVRTFDTHRHAYTSSDVIAEYRRVGTDSSFFSFMERTIARLCQLHRSSTAYNYQAALRRFRAFRRDDDIALAAFDHILAEDYEAYLKQHGLMPNSIAFHMKILRAVYNRAVEQEMIDNRRPFRTVFTGTEKTRKRAISLSDMKRLRGIDLSLAPHLAFARDMFMFLFFCRGMSFVDAAFLKKSDIKNGVLSYRRHKTNQPLYIKVEREMTEIINRYSLRGSLYLLPLINDFGDERKLYLAASHKINNSLRKIGTMLNLPIPLTTYVSRHTWATIAKRKNIPLSVISEALGHDSEKTTQIYLASIDTSVIDRANNLIIKGI